LFRLVINSAFINEQKTNFRWEITPVKNRKLDVKYIDKDGGTEEQGEINVFPEGDERGDHIFYAVFTMPDCDVDVKFIVNEDGTNASATIELVETDISFKLAGENEIKAQLRLPRGSWDGNAKGELKVTNENNDLLHKFEVKDNPKVNEDSETIIRKPINILGCG